MLLACHYRGTLALFARILGMAGLYCKQGYTAAARALARTEDLTTQAECVQKLKKQHVHACRA